MADSPKNDEKLLEHEYDGIREYDNPLPRWWLWTFYATILFVPLYYVLPHPFGEGGGNVAEYEAAVAKAQAAMPEQTGPMVTEEQLVALRSDGVALAEGKTLYETNCAACHRADGGGLIGPNLTDDAWIHGGSAMEIHNTIAVGVLAKGMPPWERILKPEQVNAVTAYVLSLAGTNPANAKAPEGPAPAAGT